MSAAGFDFSCDWKSGFVMDPSNKQRVGYLLEMQGLGMQKAGFLTSDPAKGGVQVFTPYNVDGNTANCKAVANNFITPSDDSPLLAVKAVGVIEHFSFGGAVGDPICISAYISAQNQMQLKGKLTTSLQSTVVTKLAWWIVNFDEENKKWFEEAYPMDEFINGQINAQGGKNIRLHVSSEATKVAPNIDVNVYNMYLELVPAANQGFALQFASSFETKYVRGWGLIIGSKNADAAKAASA